MNYKNLTLNEIKSILTERLDTLTDDEAFSLMQRYNELNPGIPTDEYSNMILMDRINLVETNQDN